MLFELIQAITSEIALLTRLGHERTMMPKFMVNIDIQIRKKKAASKNLVENLRLNH